MEETIPTRRPFAILLGYGRTQHGEAHHHQRNVVARVALLDPAPVATLNAPHSPHAVSTAVSAVRARSVA